MLNFSVDPYRDDFDPNKHFHRILFRPGRAVQARELTQMQTILQDQISKFASHIFAQNSPVSGGQITLNLDCYYLKLNPEYDGTVIDVNSFLNRIIRNDIGSVYAKVIAIAEETNVGGIIGDPPTLIVSYYSGEHFVDGDIVYAADSSNFVVSLVSTNSTGKSSTAYVSEGVFYVINGYNISNVQNQDGSYSKYTVGHFVSVQPQTIILEKYNNLPTLRIGLGIYETINDYVDDVSLLDPAIGASSYQSPGADRFTINLVLESRTYSSQEDQAFIELTRVDKGLIKRNINSSVYSIIDDYFAKRTTETNGDFVTEDFTFTPKPNSANNEEYILSVSKGIAYVNGYRVENQSELEIESTRSREFASSNSSVYFDYGNYFYVDSLNGLPEISNLPTIDLHCTTRSKVNTTNLIKYTSTLVGTAVLRNIERYTTDVYRAFVFDIQTNSLTTKANTAKGISFTPYVFAVDTNNLSLQDGVYDSVEISVISGRSSGDKRTISSFNSNGMIVVADHFTEILDDTSTILLNFSTKDVNSYIVQGTSNTIYGNINTAYGKDRGIQNASTKLVSTTEPELVWKLGNSYVKTQRNMVYSGVYLYNGVNFTTSGPNVTATINTDSLAGCTFNGDGDLSVDVINENFIIANSTNYIVSFDDSCTVTVDPVYNKTCTVTLPSAYGTGSYKIWAKLSVFDENTSGTRSFKYKDLYTGNTSSYIVGTQVSGTNTFFNSVLGQVLINNSDLVSISQPQSLYVSDVKKIVKILDTKNKTLQPSDIADFFTNSTYDVTSQYGFFANQKDSYYDHSYIKMNYGSASSRGNLLVIFDYYNHEDRIGYFCTRSYLESTRPDTYAEILNSNYVGKNGTKYNLSDCIDFRPSRGNGVKTFTFSSNNLIPDYLSTFLCEYDYYLARKDLLVINKNKLFEIITGTPSTSPQYPQLPEGALDLAKIRLDAYTAYITGENSVISNIAVEKIPHKTWKMKNISDLESRVNNIEYFTSLSILEKNASDLQIPDENGLNRFKYGILADDFSSFSVSNTADYDYNCSINKLEKALSPSHTVMNFDLSSALLPRSIMSEESVYSSLGFKAHNVGSSKYFTLSYVTANAITQSLASRTVNVNPMSVIDREGSLNISPTTDTYVDNLKLPSLMIHDPNLSFYEPSDTINEISQSDWKLIPGTLIPEKLIDATTVVDNTQTTTIYKTFETKWKEDQYTRYAAYKKLNANFIETNDFITDINIMPYIRSQPILMKAESLYINTPVNCYFDNTNVNKYMQLPNIIKVVPSSLTDSSAWFVANEAIGFMSNINTFIYTGNIISVTNVMDRTKTTPTLLYQVLYVIDDFMGLKYGNDSGVIVNGVVSTSQTVVKGTRTGTISDSVHSSGIVASVIDGTHYEQALTIDETGRDYTTLTKAEEIALYTANANGQDSVLESDVYYPATQFKDKIKIVTKYSNVTKIEISTLAQVANNITSNFYNSAIITIFNEYGDADTPWTVSTTVKSYDKANNVVEFDNPISFNLISRVGIALAEQYKQPCYTFAKYSIVRNTTIYQNDEISETFAGTRNNPISFDEPLPLMTSMNGTFAGILHLPGKTFYSGTKTIRVDNGIDKNKNSATCFAESPFFASNLATQSQSLQFGAVIPGFSKTEIRDKSSIRKTTTVIPPPPRKTDPLAQTFLLPDSPTVEVAGLDTTYVGQGSISFPNGAFLRSISLFFRTRSMDMPVSMFLVRTTNGEPDLTKPFENSIVIKQPWEVNTSERPHYLDSDTKTVFEFKVPIYIPPGQLCAFALKSNSLDYTLWVAAQSDYVLPSTQKALPTDPDPQTTEKLSGNPYLGAVFESQNAITWSADQRRSIMFVADACEFNITNSPRVDFVTGKYNPERRNVSIENLYHTHDSDLAANTGVLSESNIVYDAFNVSTLDQIPPGAYIDYSYDSTPRGSRTLTGTRTNVNPGKYCTPIAYDVYFDDGKGNRVLTANSNSSFVLSATLSSDDKWISPVVCDEGTSLYTVNWIINDLGIYEYNIHIFDGGQNYNVNTEAEIVSSGTGYGASANISYDANGVITSVNILNSGLDYATTPNLYLKTRTTGITKTGNNVITFNTANGSIANGSVYVGQAIINVSNTAQTSPVLYANNSNGYVYVETPVFGNRTGLLEVYGKNPNIVINGETSPSNGNALSKYITKKVTLATNQEAGDLRAYFTAYKPLGTNIHVYYKILSGEDTSNFDDGNWQLMTYINSTNKYSMSRSDYIEYVTAPGIGNVANNFVSYITSSGNMFRSFNQFAIKVVMSTTDKTKVPTISDLRVIALPSGTGM